MKERYVQTGYAKDSTGTIVDVWGITSKDNVTDLYYYDESYNSIQGIYGIKDFEVEDLSRVASNSIELLSYLVGSRRNATAGVVLGTDKLLVVQDWECFEGEIQNVAMNAGVPEVISKLSNIDSGEVESSDEDYALLADLFNVVE